MRKSYQQTLWLLLFALGLFLSYAPSPLYTGNQNNYFLHGITNAADSALSSDWLVGTTDPFPVFSLLVKWTSTFRAPGFFQVLFGSLLAIGVLSLWRIPLKAKPVQDERMSWVLLVFIVLVFSRIASVLSGRFFGFDFPSFLQTGIAEQYLVGPYLQPSVFGVFLLASIYAFLSGRDLLAFTSCGLASLFHPTYFLSTGTLLLAYTIILHREKRYSFQKILHLNLAASLLIVPSLWYAIVTLASGSPEAFSRSQEILYTLRIPHHADPMHWLDWESYAKVGMVAVTLFAYRKSRIFLVLLFPAMAGLVLTLAQIVTGSRTLGLFFPWRVFTFLVPLSVVLLFSWFLCWLVDRNDGLLSKPLVCNGVISSLVLVALAPLGAWKMWRDRDAVSHRPESRVQEFVRRNHAITDRYLIPLDWENFRLAGDVPVFVDWKSHPFKSEEVLEWFRRVEMVRKFYGKGRVEMEDLEKISRVERITHVILPTGTAIPSILQRSYANTQFAAYAINR